MTTQHFIRRRIYGRRRLPRLVLLWVLTLVLGFVQASHAQSGTPGGVVAWGFNESRQLDVPAGIIATAIAGGSHHSLALTTDGRVVAWGCRTDFGQCDVPAGLAGVTAISAGGVHSLALKSDGTVVAWGCGVDWGQCNVPSGLDHVTAIAGGSTHSLALKSDGTVVAWGCMSGGDSGQCSVPVGLDHVTAIAANDASLALKSDGTVIAWGCNGNATRGCAVPAGLNTVIAIAAGEEHGLAVKSDGTVLAWGCRAGNDYGQCGVPAGLGGVTAIAAGAFHSLALKDDGTVVAWGCEGEVNVGQCSVPAGLGSVTAIAAGRLHSLAIHTDTTPPVITANVAGTLGSNGWYKSNVTVSWSVVDNESTVTSTVNCGNTVISTDTTGTTVTCTATSAGGTASESVILKRDATPPVVALAVSAGTLGSSGWYISNVTVATSGTDATSGIASCTPAQTLTADSAGTIFTGNCTDQAGNTASAAPLTIKLDKTMPSCTVSATPNTLWPPNHKLVSIAIGLVITDNLSGADGFALRSVTSNEPDSGLDEDVASDIQGWILNTADTSGQLRAERSDKGTGRLYTLTYQGRDLAGNTATCSTAVQVPHDKGH